MITQPYSIRRYLTSHILFWVILMTSLPIIWVYWDARHEVDELFDASLAQSARVLHGLLNRETLGNSRAYLTESLRQKDPGQEYSDDGEKGAEGHAYEKKVAFQVWNTEGGLVLKSASAPGQPLADFSKGYAQREINDHHWRTFTLFSEHDQWWLIVGEQDDIREEITSSIINSHVWPLLLITPLLAWITWQLIDKSLRPLENFSAQVDSRHYQDLSELDKAESPQEISGLAGAINGLFQRLNRAYQRESRFSGNAAHELRNPLAALMIHTENALEDNQHYLQQANLSDTGLIQHLQQQQTDLSMIRQGINRLSHIVQQLLALSRAEARQQTESHSFDLAQLCHESIHLYQAQIESKQQRIELIAPEPCHLAANQSLIVSLLNNLLSNAISYTPNQGLIRLCCHVNTTQVTLMVEDSGPGIPEAERERVKDRFYRLNGNEAYGVGLGLSITEAIVMWHGADWELGQSELGGLAVNIHFPVQQTHRQ